MGFNLKEPNYILSSELKVKGKGTTRLINILKEVGATEYISGLAAGNYLEEDKFTDIKLSWFNYKHPTYPNMTVPYLSCVDLLFNAGDNSKDYIRGMNDSK